jgi:hypothetical protein
VPLSHYPKTIYNSIFTWVQPPPPEGKLFHGQPKFSELNLFRNPVEPGNPVVGYHDAANFTRFFGSFFCDQPLLVVASFSNDETDARGDYVTDETLPELHYDAEALRHVYDPLKQGPTGKAFWVIFGRWVRVEVTNTGTAPTKVLRVAIKGSVF